MIEKHHENHLVAVIGAGPAGLYAAQYLARHGVQVVLFNRDIKPGGLAEYGIFPDKHKMRSGLQAQFYRILEMPNVNYRGNVVVGQSGDVKLDQLRRAGFQAFMVTTGAQKSHWLGLPGEDLEGVYQANDIVFYYNRLPEKSHYQPDFGRHVLIIGLGNVMLDIVHYLSMDGKPHIVTAVGRRGPVEVKFDKPTLVPVAGCLDMEMIEEEVASIISEVRSVGGNAAEFFNSLNGAREKADTCPSALTFHMRFLRSPRRIIGDVSGHVKEVVFEVNRLTQEGGEIIATGMGKLERISADTVIFSIGSRVDEGFGLPAVDGNFVTTPNPRFPIDGISYELFNPQLCAHCEDIFVSGWARSAGEGVVGLARKDGERGARAVLKYLGTLPPVDKNAVERSMTFLPALEKKSVNLADLEKLRRAEQKIAAEEGLPSFKFDTKEKMLDIIRGD